MRFIGEGLLKFDHLLQARGEFFGLLGLLLGDLFGVRKANDDLGAARGLRPKRGREGGEIAIVSGFDL